MAAARGGKAKSDEPHFDAPADVDVVATFEGMGLKQNLLRGIFEFGFEKPTAIQQRAIVPMISGRDVIAQAQSGTGKTAMLSISALQVVNVHSREVQVLCLNPTRELAVQVRHCLKFACQSLLSLFTDSQSCKCNWRRYEHPGAPVYRRQINWRRHKAPRSWRSHRQRHSRPSV
jgi:superfamily II DNA/RNA helicase